MNVLILESDWKYLRKIEPDMLANLCSRINTESQAILTNESMSEHEKYLELYKHIKDSDKIIADCFNDWRRSNIDLKIRHLWYHGLLGETHLNKMSDGIRTLVENF